MIIGFLSIFSCFNSFWMSETGWLAYLLGCALLLYLRLHVAGLELLIAFHLVAWVCADQVRLVRIEFVFRSLGRQLLARGETEHEHSVEDLRLELGDFECEVCELEARLTSSALFLLTMTSRSPASLKGVMSRFITAFSYFSSCFFTSSGSFRIFPRILEIVFSDLLAWSAPEVSAKSLIFFLTLASTIASSISSWLGAGGATVFGTGAGAGAAGSALPFERSRRAIRRAIGKPRDESWLSDIAESCSAV